MATTAVKISKNYKTPKEPGTYHRLLCMTGKNKGTSYFLSNKRVVLGRSDKADVQVLDTKSSREHAELALVGGKYVLTDLGSQNGVIVNDLKVSQHRLVDNDKVIIGSTVYKYNSIVVKNELVPVEEEDLEEYEEEEEEEEEVPKKKGKKGKKGKKPTDEEARRKKLIMIAFAIVAMTFLLPDEQRKKGPKKAPTKGPSASLEDDGPKGFGDNEGMDKELRVKLGAIIHRGRREMREQNYFRAIEQFNLALILDPNNGEASFLLNKTKQRLDDQIKAIMAKGAQEENSLKYLGAIKQYCQVISYLQDYKEEDERYKQAEEKVEFIEEKLGMDKGEYKCF